MFKWKGGETITEMFPQAIWDAERAVRGFDHNFVEPDDDSEESAFNELCVLAHNMALRVVHTAKNDDDRDEDVLSLMRLQLSVNMLICLCNLGEFDRLDGNIGDPITFAEKLCAGNALNLEDVRHVRDVVMPLLVTPLCEGDPMTMTDFLFRMYQRFLQPDRDMASVIMETSALLTAMSEEALTNLMTIHFHTAVRHLKNM